MKSLDLFYHNFFCLLAIRQLNMASVWDAWDNGYWVGELTIVFPISLFFLQWWLFEDPVEAKDGSYFAIADDFAGLSLILALTVGIKKSLYLSVAREDDDYIIVFGVNFYSISIFEIFLSKGLITRFGSDFCLKIVVGMLTDGRLDFFDVILLEATTRLVFFPCLSMF